MSDIIVPDTSNECEQSKQTSFSDWKLTSTLLACGPSKHDDELSREYRFRPDLMLKKKDSVDNDKIGMAMSDMGALMKIPSGGRDSEGNCSRSSTLEIREIFLKSIVSTSKNGHQAAQEIPEGEVKSDTYHDAIKLLGIQRQMRAQLLQHMLQKVKVNEKVPKVENETMLTNNTVTALSTTTTTTTTTLALEPYEKYYRMKRSNYRKDSIYIKSKEKDKNDVR